MRTGREYRANAQSALSVKEVTDKELKKVLKCLELIPSEQGRDEAIQIVLKAAAESITLEHIKKISSFREEKKKDEEERRGCIKFTKKEIESMPDNLKKLFIVNDKIVSYRYFCGVYQARFRRDGYNIEVAHKDFGIMKLKFLEKLKEAEKKMSEKQDVKVYPKFGEFLQEWLKIKKQTVKPSTYKAYCDLTNFNLVPRFSEIPVNEITRKVIQEFLFEITDAGKNRTAHKLKQMLNAMFEVIVDDYPELTNPTKKVVLSHYVVKKGQAFSKDEEKQVIDFCKQYSHYQGNSAILTLMYTGMRVGELSSVKFDGTFITCVSEKTRKGHQEIVRKIPVSPMLKRVLHMIDFDKVVTANKATVRDAVKRIFPDRHIHEFRYTFITRAKECGCNPEVVMLWVGHEFDDDVRTSRVDRGYTTYSDEYLLSEINKINYEYEQKC